MSIIVNSRMISETLHCKTCHLDFKNSICYKKHLNTSRHIQRSTNSNLVTYSCICGKSYLYHQSLYVHHKKCEQYQTSKHTQQDQKSEVEIRENLSAVQKELDETREKLVAVEKERDEMKAQHITTNTNTNTNTKIDNQTNNNITININAFGNENTEYIDEKAILACISRVYNSIPTLLQKIHFDPKHPENHNIKITNKKLPYASVMGNNRKWKTVDRKDAIEKMVQNGFNILDEQYSENKDKLSTTKQQNFEGFLSKFEIEDKEVMKLIKNEVDMMVLNTGGT